MPPELEDYDLPADFQQLAARLTRESGELARQYPPTKRNSAELTSVDQEVSGNAAWLRRLLGGGLAAATLLAIAAGSWQHWSAGDEAVIGNHEKSQVSEAATGPSLLADPTSPPKMEKLHPVSVVSPGESVAPTLSAPEWEAVLDLTPAEKWEGVELSL